MSYELELAIEAAKKAGDYLKKRENITVDALEGKDIKLSSDKNSEKIIMDVLGRSNIAILSEEYGIKGNIGERFWIIDPLDGTINYYRGMDDLACVSIALWDNDRPVLGVVFRFKENELFYGEKGNGAFLNGKRIDPSKECEIKQSIIATGFSVKRDYDESSLSSFINKVKEFKKVRMLGAAAIMSTYVACGRVDCYMEDSILLWDVAAGVAIVNAAGGITEINVLDENKCDCKCFANVNLQKAYHERLERP